MREEGKAYPVTVKTVTLLTPLSEDGTRDEENRESLRFLSAGTYTEKDGLIAISYTENEGDAAVSTAVTVYPDGHVEILRTGGVRAAMRFVQNKREESVYEVPPFAFPLAVTLTHALHNLKKGEGSLRLSYQMTLGGAKSEVAFQLSVTRGEALA